MTRLENCNRCCSDTPFINGNGDVCCLHCGFTETREVWQLRGWRRIDTYPPTFGGVIFVYGPTIGRTCAQWDSSAKVCSNPDATHWFRTSDPRKQIGMV
jgi:hypothetical protein